MFKAFKYRIYPNRKQRNLINHHIGCCRYIYNYALNLKNDYYEKYDDSLSAYDLMKVKPNHKWLDKINKQSLNQAILNMETAFKNYFNNKDNGRPKFKAKHRSNHSYTLMSQGVKVDFENNKIKLAKIKKPIRIKYTRLFEGKIKRATVSKTKTNKYYISILVDTQKEAPKKGYIKRDNSIGIDVGLKNFMSDSNDSMVEAPKYLRKMLNRIKVIQKRARKKKKGSKNLNKEYRKIARLYEKVTNRRKDFLHKLTSSIVHENQGAVVVEDLNILGMLKNKKISLSIMDVSWSEFFRQLEYKCEWYGVTFVKIDRWFPSSKKCNKCKHINKKLELKDREWTCKCGEDLNRDLNAAKNILDEGLRVLGMENNSGGGTTVESVEMSSLDESVKQKVHKIKNIVD